MLELRIILCFFLYTAIVAGCTIAPGTKTSPTTENIQWHIDTDPLLKKKITKFWQARILRKWDECYELEAPDVQKNVPLDFYRLYHNGGWKIHAIDILETRIRKDNTATAIIKATYTTPDNEIRTQKILDPWAKIKGNWFHHFHDPLIRPHKNVQEKTERKSN